MSYEKIQISEEQARDMMRDNRARTTNERIEQWKAHGWILQSAIERYEEYKNKNFHCASDVFELADAAIKEIQEAKK